MKKKQLVRKYGTLWVRNKHNISQLRKEGNGVYILSDGSMPVYVGKGYFYRRIRSHYRSKSKGQFWDHFSWFGISDKTMRTEVEALLLKMLPFYLRGLNRQRANFVAAKHVKEADRTVEFIKRPHFVTKRKRRTK